MKRDSDCMPRRSDTDPRRRFMLTCTWDTAAAVDGRNAALTLLFLKLCTPTNMMFGHSSCFVQRSYVRKCQRGRRQTLVVIRSSETDMFMNA